MKQFRIISELKQDLQRGIINYAEYRKALKQLHRS